MRFSIIVPVYNVAPYLRYALESVLAQDCRDWECICVDDGATDDSGAILDEYAIKDERIRVIHKGNGGVSSARNLALEKAKGDWVAFLDGDDLLRSGLLSAVSNVMDAVGGIDLIKFGLTVFADGTSPNWRCGECDYKVVDMLNVLPTEALDGWFCQRIYKRSLLNGVIFPDYRIGEDMVYLATAASRANRMAVLGGSYYGYRRRKGSASSVRKSLQDVKCMLSYLTDWFGVVDGAAKTPDKIIIRQYANAMTESLAHEIFRLRSDECAEGFSAANAAWRKILKSSSFPISQKLRIALYLLFGSPQVAKALFCFPYWLKQKGIHR